MARCTRDRRRIEARRTLRPALIAVLAVGAALTATPRTTQGAPLPGPAIQRWAQETPTPTPEELPQEQPDDGPRGSGTPVSTATPSQPTRIPVGVAEIVWVLTENGTGPGAFDDPRALAVDGAGKLYVADFSTGRIQQFDEDGKYLTDWKIALTPPLILDIAADRKGNLYVVQGGRIHQYNGTTGKLLASFGAISASLYWDVSVLPNGDLLALSSSGSNDDLVRLNAQGRELSRVRKIVSAQTNNIELASLSLAVDGRGNIFITSSVADAVFRFAPDGKFVSRFGKKANNPRAENPGEFRPSPQTVAVDSLGRIYVPDFFGIYIFEPNGTYLDSITLPVGSGVVRRMAFNDKDDLFLTTSVNRLYRLALRKEG